MVNDKNSNLPPPPSPEAGSDVVGTINLILESAVNKKASDIHVDAERDSLNVRFRIDGFLHPEITLDKYYQERLVSRLKVMAQLNISEHQMPQSGHLEFKHGDRIYNVRLSTVPTQFGESLTMRVLEREEIMLKDDDLGANPEQMEMINQISKSPYGLVIVTGPTGSGKTTFLYSLVNSLNSIDRSIVTVEDPVEYNIAGIRQMQIRESVGFDFHKAMGAVVRQDPDVIMLGEIVDDNTAQAVFQAALSGILAFTTFHTFDVPALLIRLLEMKIPRSVIAHTIRGVLLTRLVRKVCQSCKEEYIPSESEKMLIGIHNKIPAKLTRGKGCDKCHNTGYLGRSGIFDITLFDDDIRFAIIDEVSLSDLDKLVSSKKKWNLWDSAMEKVVNGVTTLDEAIRVVGYPKSVSGQANASTKN
ncbi:MAG: type II secretion system protein GspE [Candidatus Yanofskybacteria bacterium CG10_big_fil_rev_8_21_14_0_10_36_16]|uniref:Type II secretion system protein GspE n=1 Tax=Candidatus Yanofskybacteria bacterium CG10_big_fil_rev_8_21_14_0_10_36_16 TaxID=1975096 RepID=A0A2J0Q7F5_9BACT|nr:MAG: type II secretion system protein GspE [Candidatus Yanofskybacteria bacterium CG10_big_fil_rev_8_21_14_0_10_36_16]